MRLSTKWQGILALIKVSTILFLTLSICPLTTKVYATTTVQVISADPPGNSVELGRNQNFYLHLRYRTDEPVHIWVKPYFHGKEVAAGTNPSRIYPAGDGEALGWFFLFKPGLQVDEIRITAGDGSLAGTPVVATYPVHVTGDDQPTTSKNKPDWATRLSAIDAADQKTYYKRQMNTPITLGDRIFFGGLMLGILTIGILGFVAPVWGLLRWSGRWRFPCAIPAAMIGFVVLRIFVDTSSDPTSHNLWPFEILQVGTLSLAIMIVLVVARKLIGVRHSS